MNMLYLQDLSKAWTQFLNKWFDFLKVLHTGDIITMKELVINKPEYFVIF